MHPPASKADRLPIEVLLYVTTILIDLTDATDYLNDKNFNIRSIRKINQDPGRCWPDGIRTRTVQILSLPPLPLGYKPINKG